MDTVVVIGASVRAAAFSAIRAGLRPWAIDLFADRDLAAVCPVRLVPTGRYPAGLVDLAREAPPGPWLYTGALENRPAVVERIARERPLWGNDAGCLRRVRDPFALFAALRAADVPSPAVRPSGDRPSGEWLVKPLAGAGGVGVRRSSGRFRDPARRNYLQQFVGGEPCSGVFVADDAGCRLLGVTRQLIGKNWLHVGGFRYAGSVGPLVLNPKEAAAWERLGSAVTAFAGLRGVFGIDAVMRDGVPWPVEVNPRYTASVEVIEYATGIESLSLHRQAYALGKPCLRKAVGMALESMATVGKAIWYSPRAIAIPSDGPWEAVLHRSPVLDKPPSFADIPPVGQRITAGRPVLTFFATAHTADECERRLRAIAGELDILLLR
jgi:predicted ATP-grasp superfamily ATP-dependent carboligase